MLSRHIALAVAVIGLTPAVALAKDGGKKAMHSHHRVAARVVQPAVIHAWQGGYCTNGFGVSDPWPFMQTYYGEIRDRLRDDWSCAPAWYD